MGLFDRIGWWRKSSGSEAILRELFGRPSLTGRAVNAQTALQVSVVISCLRVLAEGVAQVPWKLFRVSEDGRTRQPAREHPLYDLLHMRPNDWQTSFEFREMMVFHAALTGDFVCFKNIVGGRVVELIPFESGQVTIKRHPNYELEYEITANGQRKPFPASTIWHVRGPSWNGWRGLEAVKLAREAIGLALATEEHHARMHKMGVRPGSLLSVEGTLKDDRYEDLKKWIEENHAGTENSWKTMIMDRSAKLSSIAQSGVDAQHLETRRFQIEEICRFFRVNPIMAGYSDKATTYASAEQQFLAHVVHTLAPWYQRLEQSADVNLLTPEERRDGYYTKFVIAGLLRGALKDTAEFLAKMTQSGIMTRNEGRDALELNPLEGLDEPLTPVNLQTSARTEDNDPEKEKDR